MKKLVALILIIGVLLSIICLSVSAEESEPAAQSDSLYHSVSGTYVLNPTLNFPNDLTIVSVDFYSNGIAHTGFDFTPVSTTTGYNMLAYLSNYYPDKEGILTYNFGLNEYSSVSYRTIYFGLSEQTVSSSFYNWLTSNAVKQDSGGGTTQKYYVSGTKTFNDTLNNSYLNAYNQLFNVDFTSGASNTSYSQFFIYQSGDIVTVSYNDTKVYDSTLYGWGSPSQYKTVNFGETPQEVDEHFYLWLNANTVSGDSSGGGSEDGGDSGGGSEDGGDSGGDTGGGSTSEYTLFGYRYFKSTISKPTFNTTGTIEQNINFTSNGSSYTKMTVQWSPLVFLVNYNDVQVYEPALTSYPDNYKAVYFGSTLQTVSKDFYDWIIANTTTTPESSGGVDSGGGNTGSTKYTVQGVYVLNLKLSLPDYSNQPLGYLENVSFVSNNTSYEGFRFKPIEETELFYVEHLSFDGNDTQVHAYNSFSGFYNLSYRVINFGDSPKEVSEFFYKWLGSNTFAQFSSEYDYAYRLGYDDGVRDSESSNFLRSIFGFLIPGENNTTIIQALDSPLFSFTEPLTGTQINISIMTILGTFVGAWLVIWFLKMFAGG